MDSPVVLPFTGVSQGSYYSPCFACVLIIFAILHVVSSKLVCFAFYHLDITSMVDGRRGSDGSLATRIYTSEHSVSIYVLMQKLHFLYLVGCRYACSNKLREDMQIYFLTLHPLVVTKPGHFVFLL